MQSTKKLRKQSERYRWNVSVLRHQGSVVYEAALACRSQRIFRRRYHQETAAALAVDLAKALLHGESAEGRLNFPGDSNIQRLAIDFRRAESTMRKDLLEQGHSEETSLVQTQEMFKAITLEVLESVRDALRSGKVPGAEASSCKDRVRLLEEALEIDANESFSTIVGRSAFDIRCGVVPATVMTQQTVEIAHEGADGLQEANHLCGTATEDHRRHGDSNSSSEDSKTESAKGSDEAASATANPKGAHSCDGTVVVQEFGDKQAETSDLSNETASWIRDETRRDLWGGAVSKEAAELLLALNDARPQRMALATSCTLKNIRFIHLTQNSLYRLMDLQHVMMAKGWDLDTVGVCLLKGVMVMVSHRDDWKLRRIVSWDYKNMQLTLEDDSVITPLQISNEALEEESRSCCYALAELNHFMEHYSSHTPIEFDELIAVYYRLFCCGQAIVKLRSESDAERVLQDLIQKLVNAPSSSFLREFWKFVDPMSFTFRSHQSEIHVHTMRVLGDDLKKLFQSWLEASSDGDAQTDLETAMLKCAAELQPTSDPVIPSFRYHSVAPRDPRLASTRKARVKTTSDSTEACRAPRKRKQLSRNRALSVEPRSTDAVKGEQGKRTKTLGELNDQDAPFWELQDIDFWTDSLTCIERTLRVLRRDLCKGPDDV